MDYKSVVKQYVIENFLYGNGDLLSDRASLIDDGIVDSTGILEIVAFLEERFEISIDDEEIVPENLDTISNIVRFLNDKTQGVIS